MADPGPSTSSSTGPSTSSSASSINNNNAKDYIISEDCLSKLNNIINNKFRINSYELNSECISICGENSYGAIFQLEVIPKELSNDNIIPSTSTSTATVPVQQTSLLNGQSSLNVPSTSSTSIKNNFLIAKISPKNDARRKAMKVVKYYQREIFMYSKILPQYQQIQLNDNININLQFNAAPIFYDASLTEFDEYLILEDLTSKGYLRYNRQKSLTFDHCKLALIELAKFHAMSYILRERNYDLFYELVDQIRYDNLFTADIEPISIEFGKKYIKKTLDLIKQLNNDNNILKDKDNIVHNLHKIDGVFPEFCCKLVDGTKTEPYSVICHGDFWNNNILYKYDSKTGLPVEAKVIDYQMSRFASPVLDFAHYIFACTEKSLRDLYFLQFKDIYYNTLHEHLKLFKLDSTRIFPRHIFEEHLKSHGIYGFCMAIYAMPFFIADNSDIPDLNEVSIAIVNVADNTRRSLSRDDSDDNNGNNNDNGNLKLSKTLPSASNFNKNTNNGNDNNNSSSTLPNNLNRASTNSADDADNCNMEIDNNYDISSGNSTASNNNNSNNLRPDLPTTNTDLLDNYEMLNERTNPIYRQRMIGIVQDLEKYDFLKPLSDMVFCNL